MVARRLQKGVPRLATVLGADIGLCQIFGHYLGSHGMTSKFCMCCHSGIIWFLHAFGDVGQMRQQEASQRKAILANPVQMDNIKKQIAAVKAAKLSAKAQRKAEKKAKKQAKKVSSQHGCY